MGSLLFERERFAIRFRYPDTLFLTTDVTMRRSTGTETESRRVALAADNRNMIIVSRRDLAVDTAFSEWDTVRSQIDAMVSELLPETLPGRRVDHVGTRGMEYAGEDAEGLHTWLTVMFDHAVQYNVNCQSTPGGRARIRKAGELVFATMEHTDRPMTRRVTPPPTPREASADRGGCGSSPIRRSHPSPRRPPGR